MGEPMRCHFLSGWHRRRSDAPRRLGDNRFAFSHLIVSIKSHFVSIGQVPTSHSALTLVIVDSVLNSVINIPNDIRFFSIVISQRAYGIDPVSIYGAGRMKTGRRPRGASGVGGGGNASGGTIVK